MGLGKYDLLMIMDVPNSETVAKIILAATSRGAKSSVTLQRRYVGFRPSTQPSTKRMPFYKFPRPWSKPNKNITVGSITFLGIIDLVKKNPAQILLEIHSR